MRPLAIQPLSIDRNSSPLIGQRPRRTENARVSPPFRRGAKETTFLRSPLRRTDAKYRPPPSRFPTAAALRSVLMDLEIDGRNDSTALAGSSPSVFRVRRSGPVARVQRLRCWWQSRMFRLSSQKIVQRLVVAESGREILRRMIRGFNLIHACNACKSLS